MTGGTTIDGAQNRPLLIAVADEWRDFVSGNPEGTPDPSPGGAELLSIAPGTAVAGSAALTLTATGTAFVRGVHQVVWNGSPVATTFVSGTSLTAQVTPPAVAGSVTVRVQGAEGSKTFTAT